MSTTHELKTWPVPFQAVRDGIKRHEIRVNDRDFREGDTLRLREFRYDVTNGISGSGEFEGGEYTGRECHALVTYKTRAGTWGLPADLCVMSIEVISTPETP